VALAEVAECAITLQPRRELSALSPKATHRVESYSIQLNRVDTAEVISECTIALKQWREIHVHLTEMWRRESDTWKPVRETIEER
jgi:hypothetical protein